MTLPNPKKKGVKVKPIRAWMAVTKDDGSTSGSWVRSSRSGVKELIDDFIAHPKEFYKIVRCEIRPLRTPMKKGKKPSQIIYDRAYELLREFPEDIGVPNPFPPIAFQLQAIYEYLDRQANEE